MPKKLNFEIFKERSKNIHGNKYNYEKVVFVNTKTKVCIICPEHGEFWQIPETHMKGSGCPKCAVDKNKKITKREKLTKEQFIEKANIIHNNKYNYDKSNYINKSNKIIITCPEHGDFEQVANVHLNGSGCPKCSESHGEKLIRNLLENLNVCYEYQKHLNLNLNNKLIIVDFYIEYKDKIYIIEYNGRQHYEPIDYFGGEETFKRQQLRDILLEKYCELNNIQLIILTYDQNENVIESILNSYFKEF